jgi:DNA-binding NtrC family response regulator
MTLKMYQSKSGERKTGSLLIIEPDSQQRKGIAVLLMDDFSDIAITGSLDEAFQLASEREFNIIITEADFGNMTGEAYLKKLRSLQPAARIIIITADTDSITDEILSLHKPVLLLEKPLDLTLIKNTLLTTEKGKLE